MNTCARCDYRGDLLDHALDVGHWPCRVCNRSLKPDEPAYACDNCLSDFRSTLAGILVLYAELPRHLRTVGSAAPSGARNGADGPPLPGGPALALLGPGSPGAAARRLTRTDITRGVDGREHRVDNLPTDPPSVAWVLGNLEDDWRHTRGDDPAMTGTSTAAVVRGAARYLEVHARWAANNHDAFDECLNDLRDLHTQLEQATHRTRRPTKAGASCFECGGDLQRRVVQTTVTQGDRTWTGPLEEDAVTCRDCREQYDASRYGLALKAAADQHSRFTDPDGLTWATPAVLAGALGRSEHTIRSWHQRGQVDGAVLAGVLFVHAEQVELRHAERAKGRTA